MCLVCVALWLRGVLGNSVPSLRPERVGLEDVRERVARLGRQLGRFGGLRVGQRSEHLFQIDA